MRTAPFTTMLDAPTLQVWLESEASGAQYRIVSYVQASEAAVARYQLRLTRESAVGRSEIRQAGTLSLAPGVPQRLSSNAVNRELDERCALEIEVFENERHVRTWRFSCPK